MRLLVTVVCCLIVIHGSSSVPGSRRKQAKRILLAQALGQGLSLNRQSFGDGNGLIAGDETKKESPVTNINIQNIIHDSDNSVQEGIGIANYDSNVHSRGKREAAIPKKKKVRTYRYVSQPRKSRFSYIQKIQKLFEPKQDTTPKVVNKHKKLVMENHTEYEEHHSEEIDEHHTTTTSHLKITKKKKPKKKSNSLSPDETEDTSGEEEVNNSDRIESSNAKEIGTGTKERKSINTKVGQLSSPTVAVRNETQKSILKGENELKKSNSKSDIKPVSGRSGLDLVKEINTPKKVQSKDQSAGITKVGTIKPADLSGLKKTILQTGKDTTVDSSTSATIQKVMNVSKSQNGNNFPILSSVQKSANQNVPSGVKNVKSFFKNVLGLGGNNSTAPTETVKIGNLSQDLKNSSPARNVSTILNGVFNSESKKETNNNNNIDKQVPTIKVPSVPKSQLTSRPKQVQTPLNPSKNIFSNIGRPINNLFQPITGLFNNAKELNPALDNTEINKNIETDNSESVLKVPKVVGNQRSVLNVPDLAAKVPKVVGNQRSVQNVPDLATKVPNIPKLINVKNMLGLPSSQIPVTSVPNIGVPNGKANPSTREIISKTDVIESEMENTEENHNVEIDNSETVLKIPKVVKNLPSVPNVPNMAAVIPTLPKLTTSIKSLLGVPSSQPSFTGIPKFRRPSSQVNPSTKEIISETDVIETEHENTEENHNIEIDNSETVSRIPKVVKNLPSLLNFPNLSSKVSAVPKLTTALKNSLGIPSSQPSVTRIPKFSRPKSMVNKEVMNETDDIKSEQENTEENHNVEIDNSETVLNIPKAVNNLPSVLNLPNLASKVPTVPKLTSTINNWLGFPSSRPSLTFPQFRRPSSKANPLTKEVINQKDATEPSQEKTKQIHNVEKDNSETVLKIPKVVKNLTSVLNIPNLGANVPNVPKLTTTLKNWFRVPSSQPSVSSIPNFTVPKSKAKLSTNEVISQTDVIESEQENTEINHDEILNYDEIDNTETVIKIPKVLKNLPSVLNFPNIEAKVPTVPKLTTTVQDLLGVPSFQNPLSAIPQFRRPKNKVNPSATDGLSDKKVIDSEPVNKEVNRKVENDNIESTVKAPKVIGNQRSVLNVPDMTENVPAVPKLTGTIKNLLGVSSSFPSVLRETLPNFSGTKSKSNSPSRDVINEKDVIESDQENADENNNVEIDNTETIFKIPKAVKNLPSVLNLPNVASKVLTVPKLTSTINNWLGFPSSRPSLTFPQFRRPISKANPLTKEVINEINETDAIESEQENIDENHNVEIDQGETVSKIPKVVKNLPSVLNIPDLAEKVPNVPKLTSTIQNWFRFPSAQPSLTFPKFRRPSSKANPLTKEVINEINETDIVESEQENTDENHNVEIDQSGTVSKIPKVVKNLPSVLNIPNLAAKVPTVPKLTSTIQNWFGLPLSQPSVTTAPKFSRPKSKANPLTNDLIKETDVFESEPENTEENHNVEIDNSEAINQVPKTVGNQRSVPSFPNLPANVPTVPKLAKTIKNFLGVPSSLPSITEIPKFSGPKSKVNPLDKEIIDEIVDIGSEPENTEVIHNAETDNRKTNLKFPKIVKNVPSTLNIPSLASKVPTVPTLPTTNNDFLGVPSSKTSVTGIPQFRRPMSKTIPSGNEGLNNADVIESDQENTEENHDVEIDNSETVLNIPKAVKNLPSVLNLPNLASKVPTVPKLTSTINNWLGFPSSRPSLTFPQFRRPSSKANPLTKEVINEINETDVIESEQENTDENHNVEIDQRESFSKIPKVVKNLPSVPNVPNLTANVQTVPKLASTINNWLGIPSSKVPKFSRPKSKANPSTKEVINETDANESEPENPEENHNVEIDNSEAINKVPKTVGNQRSVLNFPNLPANVPKVPNLATTINNWLGFPLSQPSVTTVPKFSRPKSETNPSTKEVINDTDVIVSEPENTDHNVEIDNSEKVLKIPNVGIVPSIPKVFKKFPAPLIAPITTKTPNNLLRVSSSQPSVTKVPKFKRPISKAFPTSNEVLYDTDINNLEEEITDTNHEIDFDDREISFNVPKMVGKIPSAPMASTAAPTTTTTNYLSGVPSLKPSGAPTFRSPIIKGNLSPKGALLDTDIIDSVEEITDINHKEDIDNSETILNIPKTGGKIPSVPSINVPTVPKPTTIITTSPSLAPKQPSLASAPISAQLTNNVILSSPEIPNDTNDLNSGIPIKVDENVPTALKVPAVPRSPRIVPNQPGVAPLQPTLTEVPTVTGILNGGIPNKKSVPTSTANENDETANDDSLNPELNNENIDKTSEDEIDKSATATEVPKKLENLPSDKRFPNPIAGNIPNVNYNTNTFFNIPKVAGKIPKVTDNTPDVTRTPESLWKWPIFGLSPSSTNNNEDSESERYSPDIKTYSNEPKALEKVPFVPKVPSIVDNTPDAARSPKSFWNWPFSAPSPPSSKNNEDFDSDRYSPEIKSDTNRFFNEPKELEEAPSVPKIPSTVDNHPDVTKSPKSFWNWPFFKPSPPSLNNNEDFESEGYSPKIKVDTNTYPNLPVEKVHSIPKVPKSDNLSVLPRPLKSFGNWLFTSPSRTSPTNIPSHPEAVDNDEELNPDVDGGTEKYFRQPKGDLPSIPKVPELSNNIPAVPRSPMTFGNWPFSAPSQTSPAKVPQSLGPKSKSVTSTPEEVNYNEDFNPEGYNPDVKGLTNKYFRQPEAIGNFPSIPKVPKLSDNPVGLPKPLKSFGNWLFSSPSKASPDNIPSYPEAADNNEELNTEDYNPDVNGVTKTYFKQPKAFGNLPSVPKVPEISPNLPFVPRSPTTFGNWPFSGPSQTSPSKFPKLKSKSVPSSPVKADSNEDFNLESYNLDLHGDTNKYFKHPIGAANPPSKLPLVSDNHPTSPSLTLFGNWPFSTPQTSPARVPKLRRPKSKSIPSAPEYVYNNEYPETYNLDVNGLKNKYFEQPKALGIPPFIPKVPAVSYNLPAVPRSPTSFENAPFSSLPSPVRVPKLKRPKSKFVTSSPELAYHPAATRYTPYVSTAPEMLGNWPGIASPQASLIRVSKFRKPKVMTVTPSTGVFYNAAKLPVTIYNNPLLGPPPSQIAKVSRIPIPTGLSYGKDIPNFKLNNVNRVSNVPSVIGRLRPVPQVSTLSYIPRTFNTFHVPMTVGNFIPTPQVSLIARNGRRAPMVIENHPHVVVTSPVYKAEKIPKVRKTKSRRVPSVDSIAATNSKLYNPLLRSVVRKPQLLSLPTSSMIELPKVRSGLSKNRLLPSATKRSGFIDMGLFDTGLTETVHLQTDEHETVDMVVLERKAGKKIWGIPISNAVGKIEYLTVGDREGEMHFITSRDNNGVVEYLYPVRDDTGLYHNLHLKPTGGHLTLIESDYYGGHHSTGFIGYDETGEYIVPVHFEEGHRLVINPYAHSLRYAVDVHPAYDIFEEVFYYK